ncbi:MAG TPA: hypothetical protein DDW42_02665 [Desulfobacteraceae bacterium]|nr:hypothetical protein [Desulfobacteraceae bacterium]
MNQLNLFCSFNFTAKLQLLIWQILLCTSNLFRWIFSTSQTSIGIAAFDQYEHLADIVNALKTHKELAAALGGDYIVRPDIIIGKKPLSDKVASCYEDHS